MKPFDEKLADNIREVFDNYHEPFDENAWSAMQDRLQKKRKVRIIPLAIVSFASVAAALAFIAVAYFSWDFAGLRQAEPAGMAVEAPAIEENTSEDILATDTDAPHIPSSTHELPSITLPGKEETIPLLTHEPRVEPVSETFHAIAYPVSELNKMAGRTFPADDHYGVGGQMPRLADARAMMEQRLNGVSKPVTETPVRQTWENGYAWTNNGYYDDLIASRQGQGSSLLLSAGSMKTYTPDELTGGIGFSAGVAGNFPLASSISLQTGGALVYNHFTFDDMGRVLNARMGLADEFAYSDVHQIIDMKNHTDYEFLAIDIPVNFRFSLSENPANSIYVTAGLSSFLYLQQNFTSQSEIVADVYSPGSHDINTVQRSFSMMERSGEFDAFRRLDFARFLNLSAGYAIHRQDRTFVIEPFMKYPLGDVTSLDLNIGMAGVSLKYQFGRR